MQWSVVRTLNVHASAAILGLSKYDHYVTKGCNFPLIESTCEVLREMWNKVGIICVVRVTQGEDMQQYLSISTPPDASTLLDKICWHEG